MLLAPNLISGLLHIELEREVPEAMKPKTIKIQASGTLLEGDAQEKSRLIPFYWPVFLNRLEQ